MPPPWLLPPRVPSGATVSAGMASAPASAARGCVTRTSSVQPQTAAITTANERVRMESSLMSRVFASCPPMNRLDQGFDAAQVQDFAGAIANDPRLVLRPDVKEVPGRDV